MAAVIWQSLTEATIQGRLSDRVRGLSLAQVVQYFVQIKDDTRAMRDQSYQLFYRGHVQNIEVREDAVAKKSLLRCVVLPTMRTDRTYKVLIILDRGLAIDHANCDCPAGKGPQGSCKHIAAFMYALEEFVRLFSREELDVARTEQLAAWNRPRAKKMPSVPTYELPFEKQKHGHHTKERKGHHPSYYQLDKLCDSDQSSALVLIRQLKEYEQTSGNKVGFLQALCENKPIVSSAVREPIGNIIDKMNRDILSVARDVDLSREAKCARVMEALDIREEQRDALEVETRGQASVFLWMRAREKRIRASMCHRVISFTNRTSGKCVVNEILHPKSFQSAHTQFGIDNEEKAIDRYRDSRDIDIEKCGLFISTEKGFLSATPDSIVTERSGEKGILEVKALPTFKDITPLNAYKNKDYPVKMARKLVNDRLQIVPELKKKHKFYHQVQLQLYCCPFASFADFVIYHVNVHEIHFERIYPDEEWRETNIPKMEIFYKTKVVPELLK